MDRERLVLASASPRRLELLVALGLVVEAVPAGLDESPRPGESAPEHVLRLAIAKAAHAGAKIEAAGRTALVLGADTDVVLDGAVLGKPSDDDEALSMLRRLAGRAHEVFSGVRLVDTGSGRASTRVVSSTVVFRPVDEARLRWYVATGEPRDKAGAYGIQGLGVLLTERIEGSWSNVVGLPLEVLPGMFEEIGRDLYGMLRR